MPAAWNSDMTVTAAEPEVVDPENPENNTPAVITAQVTDPNQIIMAPPFVAATITVTVTMAAGAPLPAQIGQTLLARLRIM